MVVLLINGLAVELVSGVIRRTPVDRTVVVKVMEVLDVTTLDERVVEVVVGVRARAIRGLPVSSRVINV